MSRDEHLQLAKNGDIDALGFLFSEFESFLRSYLYRLHTNREDVEDFYQNTFLKASEKVSEFKGSVDQFKSWVFTIATNISLNHLKSMKRWAVDAQDNCRNDLVGNPESQQAFVAKVGASTYNTYELAEHIDFCFTCINKTLPIEHQVALLLKDLYQFKVDEVASIMNRTLGQVKHFLIDARKEMTDIYDSRCALINKSGACHQCSELQGIFNPKQDFNQSRNGIKFANEHKDKSKAELFELREKLSAAIDPLKSKGTDLHEHFMQHLKGVNSL